MIKKLIGLTVIAIMLFGVFGLSGCSNGRTFDVDGWTLFRYNGNYGTTPRGTVNIVSANSESLVVDGVLNIPAKIGKYNIHGFGRPGNGMFGSDSGADFGINTGLVEGIERIVIAEEIYIGESFYRNFDHICI